MLPKIIHNDVHEWFNFILASGLSPFLLGDVGKGKSQLAEAYAKSKQLLPHIIYLDSMYEMDVIGYAVPNKELGKFEYLPCNLFPLENDPMPINPETNKPYKGHLIIFEEFGNCPKSMQVAAQRVILDKAIGSHKLHPKASIVLLGNKVSSGANALPISAAIRSRCGIAELDTDSLESVDNFIKYMQSTGFHSSVVDWVSANKEKAQKINKALMTDGESPFLTWRGLGAVSNMMNKLQQKASKEQKPLATYVRGKLVVFQSLIGYSEGADFYTTIMNPAQGLEEILVSPTTANIPSGTAQLLKTASFLASNVTTDSLVDSMLVYLDRLNPEACASIVSKVTQQSPYLEAHPRVKKYHSMPF